MNAVQYVHFIQPVLLIALVFSILASIRYSIQTDKQAIKPLKFNRLLWWMFPVLVVGWLLVVMAGHTQTPIIRVNLFAFGKLFLWPSLIVTFAICAVRLFQRNNLLSQLGGVLVRILGHLFSILLPLFALGAASAVEAASSHKEGRSEEEKAYDDPKGSVNPNGDYCDKDKWNWYC